MKKLLQNKNFYLLVALVVLIAVLFVVGKSIQVKPSTPPPVVPVVTAVPEATATAEPAVTATTIPEATAAPAENTAVPESATVEEVPLGYIFVQSNGEGGWIPLSTGEDFLVTVSREGDDTIKNVIRLTQTGFVMDSSTCDNQDCVQQGEVTLENKDDRVLMNMVLCLPHNLSVELYSIEEVIAMMEQYNQQNPQ